MRDPKGKFVGWHLRVGNKELDWCLVLEKKGIFTKNTNVEVFSFVVKVKLNSPASI